MFKEKLKALMKNGYFVEFRPDVAQPDRRMILSVYKEGYWHRTLISFTASTTEGRLIIST